MNTNGEIIIHVFVWSWFEKNPSGLIWLSKRLLQAYTLNLIILQDTHQLPVHNTN